MTRSCGGAGRASRRIATRRVPAARAVLRKVVVVEQRTITVEVAHEEVRLEVLPIDGDGDGVGDAVGGAHLALPELVLHEEQLVVTKRIVPVERVRPTIVTVVEERTVSESVRSERISVVDAASGA